MASGATLVEKSSEVGLCESSPEFQVPKPVKTKKRHTVAAPSGKAAPSKRKIEDDDYKKSKQLVLEYLRTQNRPYSAQNIFDNLHGAVPRLQLQNILTEASTPGELQGENEVPELLCKEYGKFKIYLIHQSRYSTAHSTPGGGEDVSVETLRDLETEIQNLTQVVRDMEQQLRSKTDHWSHLSLSELYTLRLQEQQRYEAALKRREEVQHLDSNDGEEVEENNLSAEEIVALHSSLLENQRTWKLRRGKCHELLEVIAQLLDATVNDVIEQLDIETDDFTELLSE